MSYQKNIKEKVFPWGGRALASEFPAYGSVSIVGSVVGGRRLAGNGELADIHASMLLEGTKKHDKKAIQILLDDMGASLSFAVAGERLQFTGRVRTIYLEKLLSLIAEALIEPTFPQKELAALKHREQAQLSLISQNTRAQADIHLSRILFKDDHPQWEETVDEALRALQKLTRKDLLAYHERAIDRNSLVIGIIGDSAPQKVFSLTEKYFKKLPERSITLPPIRLASPVAAQKIAIHIKEKASIDYMLGSSIGITAQHRDFPALLLGVNILGNARGFTGRLMKTVREKEGLTYGVYSYLSDFDPATDGSFVVWGTFAEALFEKGRQAIKREVEHILKDGVTAEEVKKHREMLAANWRVRLSNSGAIAHAAHDAVADGWPLSYLDDFPKKILSVTPAQVTKALKKYINPEYLSESAAGPIERI